MSEVKTARQDKPRYPYLPEGKMFRFIGIDNEFMQAAKQIAKDASLDDTMPTGSVVIKNGQVIGRGANGSNYHKEHGCYRVQHNIPTGQGYELCEGCSPKNHSEPRAIADAHAHADDIKGSQLYLWGHWWCCQPCWNAILASGIDEVYLLDNSAKLFDKNSPNNIVGRQFA